MMLMTGNTVCARVTYPDVKNSKTHAYFPLSGPVNADVIVSRTDRYCSFGIYCSLFVLRKMLLSCNLWKSYQN